jgi:hypothetical protein
MEETEHWIKIRLKDLKGGGVPRHMKDGFGGLGVYEELSEGAKSGDGGYGESSKGKGLVCSVSVENIALFKSALDGTSETWGI